MARIRLAFDRLLATINTLAGETATPDGSFRDLKNVDVQATGEVVGRMGLEKVNTESFGECDSDVATEDDCEDYGGVWIPPAITGGAGCCWRGGQALVQFAPRTELQAEFTSYAAGGSDGDSTGCCTVSVGGCYPNVTEFECYAATWDAVYWTVSGICGEDGCYTTTLAVTTTTTTTPPISTSSTTPPISTSSTTTTTAAPPDYCCEYTYDNADPLEVYIAYMCWGYNCGVSAMPLQQDDSNPCLYTATGNPSSACSGGAGSPGFWSLTLYINESTGVASYLLSFNGGAPGQGCQGYAQGTCGVTCTKGGSFICVIDGSQATVSVQ